MTPSSWLVGTQVRFQDIIRDGVAGSQDTLVFHFTKYSQGEWVPSLHLPSKELLCPYIPASTGLCPAFSFLPLYYKVMSNFQHFSCFLAFRVLPF